MAQSNNAESIIALVAVGAVAYVAYQKGWLQDLIAKVDEKLNPQDIVQGGSTGTHSGTGVKNCASTDALAAVNAQAYDQAIAAGQSPDDASAEAQDAMEALAARYPC